MKEGLVVINLTLSFGFNGAPGEYMAWTTGIKQMHEGQCPAEARRDGPERFASEGLMDDGICVEPLLGLRPWVSGSAYLEAMKTLLGPGSLNLDKEALEGAFKTRQTCWGLEYDTEVPTVRIP